MGAQKKIQKISHCYRGYRPVSEAWAVTWMAPRGPAERMKSHPPTEKHPLPLSRTQAEAAAVVAVTARVITSCRRPAMARRQIWRFTRNDWRTHCGRHACRSCCARWQRNPTTRSTCAKGTCSHWYGPPRYHWRWQLAQPNGTLRRTWVNCCETPETVWLPRWAARTCGQAARTVRKSCSNSPMWSSLNEAGRRRRRKSEEDTLWGSNTANEISSCSSSFRIRSTLRRGHRIGITALQSSSRLEPYITRRRCYPHSKCRLGRFILYCFVSNYEHDSYSKNSSIL